MRFLRRWKPWLSLCSSARVKLGNNCADFLHGNLHDQNYAFCLETVVFPGKSKNFLSISQHFPIPSPVEGGFWKLGDERRRRRGPSCLNFGMWTSVCRLLQSQTQMLRSSLWMTLYKTLQCNCQRVLCQLPRICCKFSLIKISYFLITKVHLLLKFLSNNGKWSGVGGAHL